jgi:acyl carrier protein
MDPDQARAAVLAVLATVAPEIDLATVTGDTELRFELDLDSMDFLNLIEGIAQTTGVSIPEKDYPQVETLDDLGAYVSARTEEENE